MKTVVHQRSKGGLVFLVLGIAIVGGGVYALYPHVQDSTNSEPIDAEIVSSDYGSTSAAGQQETTHFVDVTYRFTYNGEEYTGDSVFPGGRSSVSSRNRAQTVSSDYAAGDTVTAYVVDGDPTRSYLVDAEMPWWYYLIPVFGGVLVLLGLLNVVQGARGVDPHGVHQ